VAFGVDGYFVVWEDHRSTGCWVYGARVTPGGTVLDPAGIAIGWASWRPYQTVTWDGSSFVVVWMDTRNDEQSVYSARIGPDGTVLDSGLVLTRTLFLPSEGQPRVDVTRGPGGQALLLYEGWAGTVDGRTYNSSRIWGKLSPNPWVEEGLKPQAPSSNLQATVVRGCLFLPSALPTAHCSLLSADGRKVMELRSGPNDVHLLPAGVYFVVTPSPVSSPPEGERVGVRGREASGAERVSKVVVTR
jgi:hypothetical protein